jgi:hypothetical protein
MKTLTGVNAAAMRYQVNKNGNSMGISISSPHLIKNSAGTELRI